jgi:hypothetical protein
MTFIIVFTGLACQTEGSLAILRTVVENRKNAAVATPMKLS